MSARVANGVFFGAIANTLAGAVGKLTAVSLLRTGIFISVLLQLREGRAVGGNRSLRRPNCSTDLAFDGLALEVGHRVLRVENLAVEEGLLAAGLRGWDLVHRDRQRLGGLAPHVLAIDLTDQRLGV